MTTIIKILIDGAGTVGRRLVHAVSKQDDMEVVGFTKTSPDYIGQELIRAGHRLYTRTPQHFTDSGITIAGTLEDAIAQADVILCCLPDGSANKLSSQYSGKKVIYQGGEKADVGISFVAGCNYEAALGADRVRVVSCNTTSLSRVLGTIDQNYGIELAIVDLIRRGADPADAKKGPMAQIEPVIKLGSSHPHGHHGSDVNTILPNLNIYTMTVAVPSPFMHVHAVHAKLKKIPKVEQLINIDQGWLHFYQAVHQEAITIPETIDAIRAMCKLASKDESIKKTNQSLRIGGK